MSVTSEKDFDLLFFHLYKYCISEDDSVMQDIFRRKGSVPSAVTSALYDASEQAIIIAKNSYITKKTQKLKSAENKFMQRLSEFRSLYSSYTTKDKYHINLIYRLIYIYLIDAIESESRAKEVLSCISSCETEILILANELGYTKNPFKIKDFDDADFVVKKHIEKKSIMNDEYSTHFSKRDIRLGRRNYLAILKGYSSSSPFFYSALKDRFHHNTIKGGGLFIKWKGVGIVVDPGINFMENMHAAGLNIRDITYIIITHNHIDHNGDLITIDDLASQFQHKDIVLYADASTITEFEHRLPQINSTENRIGLHTNRTRGEIDPYELKGCSDIKFDIIETEHIVDDTKPPKKNVVYKKNSSFAIRIALYDHGDVKHMIGITSDTIYRKELSNFFVDCDYVIANISETAISDYSMEKLKEKHLGFNGCQKLISECRELSLSKVGKEEYNTRFIISEFWAGKGDVRREIVRQLRRVTNHRYVYPGDVGMLFFLDQDSFLCDYCKCERPFQQLNIIKPGIEYARMSCICDNCILD